MIAFIFIVALAVGCWWLICAFGSYLEERKTYHRPEKPVLTEEQKKAQRDSRRNWVIFTLFVAACLVIAILAGGN
jgi:hypothetical protein